jgi:Cu/Ag efflux protein CusF
MIKTIIAFFLILAILHNASGKYLLPTATPQEQAVNGKIYHVKATVKKKLRDENKMIIKHGRLEGYMEAMTMAFPVADSMIFDNCAVGSKGVFTLQVNKGFPVITAAHFDKLPKYVCPMHPHELSNTRGSCPICGMAYEKRE